MLMVDLDEGLMNFAKGVGRFLARCVGRGCLAYARTPVKARGTMGHMRKQLTREIAKSAGERLMDVGDGEYSPVRFSKRTPKYKPFDPNIKEPGAKTYKLKPKRKPTATKRKRK
jgi:hypothetical protein